MAIGGGELVRAYDVRLTQTGTYLGGLVFDWPINLPPRNPENFPTQKRTQGLLRFKA